VSELNPKAWSEHLERGDDGLSREGTLRVAARMVHDAVTTGVTLVLPRERGVLSRARRAAREAGIQVSVDQIDSATVTLRFSAESAAGRQGRC
jgi:hypothetical protein